MAVYLTPAPADAALVGTAAAVPSRSRLTMLKTAASTLLKYGWIWVGGTVYQPIGVGSRTMVWMLTVAVSRTL